MGIDYGPYFKKYLALVKAADQVFTHVAKAYPDFVKCKIGCSDCCHAVFDLTLIEAIYLNHWFFKTFNGLNKEKILEKANKIDRQIYRIKRKAYQEFCEGKNEHDILDNLAAERIQCPLLNQNDQCDLYKHRPLTCRFYGIPTAICEKGHTCGQSGFIKGKSYPTIHLDIVNRHLQEISAEFIRDTGSKYVKLVDMLVPLSMSLLTRYDEEYLGIDAGDKNTALRK